MIQQQQVAQGYLANTDMRPPLIVRFQFNPATITDNKAVNYADRNSGVAGNAPAKEYVGGGLRTITFDLKLHGLERGTDASNPAPQANGISTELAKLRSFLYPRPDAWSRPGAPAPAGGKRVAAPPTCVFGFGDKMLECVMLDLKVVETQFNSALAPVRADVTVTLAVIEEPGNALYERDTQRRMQLAATPPVQRGVTWG